MNKLVLSAFIMGHSAYERYQRALNSIRLGLDSTGFGKIWRGSSAPAICCYLVGQQFCTRNVNVIKGESAVHEICVQTVYVSDLGQALDFYTQALGYKVKARYGSCIAQLHAPGATLVIQEIEAGQANPDRPCTVLAFQTENIAESMARVVAAGGILLHDRPQQCPVGVFIAFKDPAGVPHEILQFTKQ